MTEDPRLLPGATGPETTRPAAVVDAHSVIRGARRVENRRELVDLALLLMVDALVLSWPASHIPGLSRRDSLMVLIAVHAFIAVTFYWTRVLPRWRAKRIAATWAAEEQKRHR